LSTFYKCADYRSKKFIFTKQVLILIHDPCYRLSYTTLFYMQKYRQRWLSFWFISLHSWHNLSRSFYFSYISDTWSVYLELKKSIILGAVCFKVKNDIPGNTWLGNDYTHVCYEVEKKIFLGIKVPGNEVTSHNFHYSHEFIPM